MDNLMLQLLRLKTKGYNCAQTILILGLEAQGTSNPDLVRAAGGLGFGINWSGEICGALSGGACLIALYAGKGSDDEAYEDRYAMMIAELVDWFKLAVDTAYGGTRCDEIIARSPDRGICRRIVAEVYCQCLEILVSHGFDPTMAKEERMRVRRTANQSIDTIQPNC